MRRPELRGKPVVVAGSGPRAVVTTASYEARRYGVCSAIPASRARRLCPEATFIPPDFDGLPRDVAAGDGARARRTSSVEVMGLDEAYLDLTVCSSPRAAMRRLDRRDRERHRPGRLGRHRPEPAGRQGRLRRREARGLRRAHAASRRASASPRPAAAAARDRPEDRRARSRRSGSPRIARLAATPTAVADRALRRPHGPVPARARALRGRLAGLERADRRLGVARDDVHHDIADRAEQERGAAAAHRAAVRGAGQERAPRAARSRSRSGSTTSPPSPAPARCPIATNDPAVVSDVACELLREYAPPRPVRLLGVRVAAFEEDGARRRGRAADDARPRDVGPIAPGGCDRPRTIMWACPPRRDHHRRGHVLARRRSRVRQPRRVRLHRRQAARSATCTATAPPTSASPRPCGRSSTTPAASPTTRSSPTRRAGPRAGSRAPTTSATSSPCCA